MKLSIKKSMYPGRWEGHLDRKSGYGFLYLPGFVVICRLNRKKSKEQLILIDGKYWKIGTELTSKENGELIEADSDTPEELIVGTVGKKGLIK